MQPDDLNSAYGMHQLDCLPSKRGVSCVPFRTPFIVFTFYTAALQSLRSSWSLSPQRTRQPLGRSSSMQSSLLAGSLRPPPRQTYTPATCRTLASARRRCSPAACVTLATSCSRGCMGRKWLCRRRCATGRPGAGTAAPSCCCGPTCSTGCGQPRCQRGCAPQESPEAPGATQSNPFSWGQAIFNRQWSFSSGLLAGASLQVSSCSSMIRAEGPHGGRLPGHAAMPNGAVSREH